MSELLKLRVGSITREITKKQLAELSVKLFGGGWDVEQTMLSMDFQRKLRDGEKMDVGDREWEIMK